MYACPRAGAGALEDPFYSVKRAVQEALRAATAQLDTWRVQTNARAADAKKTQLDLEEALANIDSDLDDLQETIEIVETNRGASPTVMRGAHSIVTGRYFSIDDNELLSRKNFIVPPSRLSRPPRLTAPR